MHTKNLEKCLPRSLFSKLAFIISTSPSLTTLVQAAMDLTGITILKDPFPRKYSGEILTGGFI